MNNKRENGLSKRQIWWKETRSCQPSALSPQFSRFLCLISHLILPFSLSTNPFPMNCGFDQTSVHFFSSFRWRKKVCKNEMWCRVFSSISPSIFSRYSFPVSISPWVQYGNGLRMMRMMKRKLHFCQWTLWFSPFKRCILVWQLAQ